MKLGLVPTTNNTFFEVEFIFFILSYTKLLYNFEFS
jgi:hypothetical protein